MPDACPRCLMTFPQHVVVRAKCLRRWRGANFHAANAQGAVGAAVAEVFGMRVRTTPELEAFMRRAYVKAYGEGLPANPDADIDASLGEHYEFHVGLRVGVNDETLDRIEAAVRGALAADRNFSLE